MRADGLLSFEQFLQSDIYNGNASEYDTHTVESYWYIGITPDQFYQLGQLKKGYYLIWQPVDQSTNFVGIICIQSKVPLKWIHYTQTLLVETNCFFRGRRGGSRAGEDKVGHTANTHVILQRPLAWPSSFYLPSVWWEFIWLSYWTTGKGKCFEKNKRCCVRPPSVWIN